MVPGSPIGIEGFVVSGAHLQCRRQGPGVLVSQAHLLCSTSRSPGPISLGPRTRVLALLLLTLFAPSLRSLSLCSLLPSPTPLHSLRSLTPLARSRHTPHTSLRPLPAHSPLLPSPTPNNNPHSATLPHARLRMAGHRRGRLSRAQGRLVARSGGGQRPAPVSVPSLRRRCLLGVRRTRAPPRGPHVCGGGHGCQANRRDQRGGV